MMDGGCMYVWLARSFFIGVGHRLGRFLVASVFFCWLIFFYGRFFSQVF